MLRERHQLFLACLLAAAFLPRLIAGQDYVGPGFDTCKTRTYKILNGSEAWHGISNETIGQYIYDGPVRGMNPDYERTWRKNFTTLTTEGCKVICEDPEDWYWKADIALTLAIISNWILPIVALLAALPYDSLHRRNDGAPWYQGRIARTIGALLNWLGSPQTALTATLFNIHQMRKCFHATLSSGEGIAGNNNQQSLRRDAYYVLSCIGQFKLPEAADEGFLEPLMYGLFRPFVTLDAGEPVVRAAARPQRKARRWTSELLQEMAFHLRMLRRRGVYPSFVSIFLFFIAYAVALVLAFADVGGRTTAHALALGILVSWLPLLVLFTILDRNPVSADRSKKLIARWLWNVDAVRTWEMQGPSPPATPKWWSQDREDLCVNAAGHHQGNAQQQVRFDSYISEFVGQGRQVGYNGLAYAVLVSVYGGYENNRRMRSINEIAEETRRRLEGHRPGSWWMLSVISLALIWLEIGMAIMISFNTPTVGLGCRSGSYVVYGCLSTLPWFAQLLRCFKRPGVKGKTLCHFICLFSTLSLGLIIFAAFSGVFNNCLCKGGLSGYMDFEDAQFYRDKEHFDVEKWWRASAIVGALPMFGSFLAAILLLMRLKPLWQASEQNNPHVRDAEADMKWLI